MKLQRKATLGRRLVLALGVATAMLVGVGVAWASIPDSSGVIHACVLKNVGTIRLIDTSLGSKSLLGHCTSLETEISWSQGGAGVPGPVGPTGPKGNTGATGPAGSKGDTGATGATGPQGEKGETGQNGADGTKGTDGVNVTTSVEPAGSNCTYGGVRLDSASGTSYVCNGAPGENGSQGPKGDKGDAGEPGTIGSLNGLNGVACQAGGINGKTQLSFDSSGVATLKCVTPACPQFPNATTTCDADAHPIAITCKYGWLDANGVRDDGCEMLDDRNESNDTPETATSLGSLGSLADRNVDASIHDSGDVDYYVFGAGLVNGCQSGSYRIEIPGSDGIHGAVFVDGQPTGLVGPLATGIHVYLLRVWSDSPVPLYHITITVRYDPRC